MPHAAAGEAGQAPGTPQNNPSAFLAAFLAGEPCFPDELRQLTMTADERESARAESERVAKAMRLATTLDDFRALLHGQIVPIERLDPVWVRQYALQRPNHVA